MVVVVGLLVVQFRGSEKSNLGYYHPLQISDYHFLPDTAKRSQRVKPCLQEGEELPRDFTALFDRTLFKLDTTVLPDVLK